MLRTRLWMGAILVVLAVSVLAVDGWLAPWYPILFFLLLALTLAACYELLQLLGPGRQPPAWLCYAGVTSLLLANWAAPVLQRTQLATDPWHWIVGTFTAFVLSS